MTNISLYKQKLVDILLLKYQITYIIIKYNKLSTKKDVINNYVQKQCI